MQLPSSTPPRVTDALDGLASKLVGARSLLVYGSLARGEFREGISDVNLVVVFDDPSADQLVAARPVLRAAWRAVRLEPWVLATDEIPQLADVFPIKIRDIQRRHVLLRGEDLFTGLVVRREHLRLRLEQELRNQLLRLRHLAVEQGDNPVRVADALRRVARSLPFALEMLVELASGRSDWATLNADAAAQGLDRATLDSLVSLHAGKPVGDPAALLGAVLTLLARAVGVVDGLEGRS